MKGTRESDDDTRALEALADGKVVFMCENESERDALEAEGRVVIDRPSATGELSRIEAFARAIAKGVGTRSLSEPAVVVVLETKAMTSFASDTLFALAAGGVPPEEVELRARDGGAVKPLREIWNARAGGGKKLTEPEVRAKLPGLSDETRASSREMIGGLSLEDYELRRTLIASALGLSVTALDKIRKREARGDGEDGVEAILTFEDDAPAAGPVHGAKLLEKVRAVLERYVFAQPYELDVIAVWVALTHCVEALSVYPILRVTSVTKGAGKSRLLEVVGMMGRRVVRTSNLTPAVFFRAREKYVATILIDEGDLMLGGKLTERGIELLGLINSSYRYGDEALRCAPETLVLEKFATHGFTAIASISRIANATESRGIPITLRPIALPGEDRELFELGRERRDPERIAYWKQIRSELAALAKQVEDEIGALAPAAIAEVFPRTDRDREIWTPLFALASLVGGGWGARVKEAARRISEQAAGGETELLARLLGDLFRFFVEYNTTFLPTGLAVKELMGKYDWINAEKLSARLREISVRPRRVVLKEEDADLLLQVTTRVRGYVITQFADAFSRYLSEPVRRDLLGEVFDDEAITEADLVREALARMQHAGGLIVPVARARSRARGRK